MKTKTIAGGVIDVPGAAQMPPAVRGALEAASASQGFNTDGGKLIHHNRNWVVRLPKAGLDGPVIAKVHQAGTGRAEVVRQVRLAEWLLDSGVLTARPAGTRWPVLAGPYFVTFTHDLGEGARLSSAELARALAQLHALPVPADLDLPPLDPAAPLLARIEQIPQQVLTNPDRRWLTGHIQELGDLFRTTHWPGETALVHGDLATFNAIRTSAGPALIDWEECKVGTPLVDLAFLAWSRDAFSTDPEEYDRFCAVYGTDVTTVDGGKLYEQVLAPLRAATGAVIAFEALSRDPAWVDEAAYRMTCVRGQGERQFGYPWGWSVASGYTKPASPDRV
ncbi:aminoglycoside phosphotransferase family protein [Kitasatospora purpeofusca]|uniref:phosphotransferase family protein n=1 Tax=Kitasatospora purpeofusca TaxID=67352 RepID=UPI002E11F7D5|nr:aminoglycoside phosphotransferase family protein [Kitasatospora purpeofusca]